MDVGRGFSTNMGTPERTTGNCSTDMDSNLLRILLFLGASIYDVHRISGFFDPLPLSRCTTHATYQYSGLFFHYFLPPQVWTS